MSDVILAAINWANLDKHNGAPYTLKIYMTDSYAVEVDVRLANARQYLLCRRETDQTKPEKFAANGREVFINPANVTRVEVIW